ncbi:MAG: hypothetical protein WCJ39_08320 [bacterium]
MKNLLIIIGIISIFFLVSCDESKIEHNTTAFDEQTETEINQKRLLAVQPPPKLSWSLERDNLIKRFLLQNDRTVMFYMYVFIEGVADPIGYYQINKVSSVNSQLTNTEQIVRVPRSGEKMVLPSPAEDGSYGTNGDGVFGFTPEDIYIEHNMKYIVATVPLSFQKPVNRLTIINVETAKQLKELMGRINAVAQNK